MVTLLSVLVLTPAMFGAFIPAGAAQVPFGLALFLMTLSLTGSSRQAHPFSGPLATTWLLLGIFAVLSGTFASSGSSAAGVLFASAVAAMLIAARLAGWQPTALKVLAGLSIVHLVATLVFYIVPGLHAALRLERFYPHANVILDYRSGLSGNPGPNALWLAIGLITFALLLVLDPRGSNLRRPALVLISLLFLTGLALTSKRAHLVTALLAILITSLLSGASKRLLQSVAVGGFSLIFLLWLATRVQGIAESLQRITDSFGSDPKDDVLSGRSYLWDSALAGWGEAPVLGHGWKSFEFAWPSGRTSTIAHNQVLNSLYETGILGTTLMLVAVLGTLVYSLGRFRQAVRAERSSELSYLLGVAFATQLMMVAYSFTTGELLSTPYTYVPYLLMVALSFSAGRPTCDRKGVTTHSIAAKRTHTYSNGGCPACI